MRSRDKSERSRSAAAQWVLFVSMLLLIPCILVGEFASREGDSFDWELAAILGTALGTSALALATGALAYASYADQAARERPHVVVQTLAWSLLPGGATGVLNLELRNVGLGPALRVEIEAVYAPDPERVPLMQFGIMPAMMSDEAVPYGWGNVTWTGLPLNEAGFRVYGTYTDRAGSKVYKIAVDESDPRRQMPTLNVSPAP